MFRQTPNNENLRYGYPIKPPCLKISGSFEERVSKNHKMLFLIHKKALETVTFLKRPVIFIFEFLTSFSFFSLDLFVFSPIFLTFIHRTRKTNAFANSMAIDMLEKCSSKNHSYCSTEIHN